MIKTNDNRICYEFIFKVGKSILKWERFYPDYLTVNEVKSDFLHIAENEFIGKNITLISVIYSENPFIKESITGRKEM